MILADEDDERPEGRRYIRPETMAPNDARTEEKEVGPAHLMAS